MESTFHPHPTSPRLLSLSSPPPSSSLLTSLLGNRRKHIKYPRHLRRRNGAIIHTANLATFPQALEALGQFPALALVDDEDVSLAVAVADRGAEDVFAVFLTRLKSYELAMDTGFKMDMEKHRKR